MVCLRLFFFALVPLLLTGAPIVDVSLTDGSELAGELLAPQLAATAEFGKIAIPIARIDRVDRRGDHELVYFQNGDRLTVRLSENALQLKTQFGQVSVPMAKVTGIRMRDARALPRELERAVVLHLPLDAEIPRDHSRLDAAVAAVATEFQPKGKYRGAHYFDGSLSAFTLHSEKLDVGGSLSICVWARMEGPSANSFQRLYQRGYGGRRVIELWVEDESTALGNVVFRINASAAPSARIDYVIPKFEYGRWYHVAAVFDDELDEMRLYVDGAEVDRTDFSGTIATGYPINVIGNWRARGERSWYGLIDDFLLFNQPLSAADVSTLFRR